LFTDFGLTGPYVGQMKAVLHGVAPHVPVVDLLHDAPTFDPMLSAYLLAALAVELPMASVFVGVVDPGVGGARSALIVRADGRHFVGPDNGLFSMVVRRASEVEAWEIEWSPDRLSASFHGRDLFAPVAGRLAVGESPTGRRYRPTSVDRPDWPDELARIVYIDAFGNAMTGTRASAVAGDATLIVGGRPLARARTFADVPPGEPFWYENSNGLVEIAVNRGRAADTLDLMLGTAVEWRP
jgi:S-adenosylmethionine hydrolase